jgi:hypothetical protein
MNKNDFYDILSLLCHHPIDENFNDNDSLELICEGQL